VAVLHRNAPAETFTLEYQNGLFVPAEAVATADGDHVGWFRQEERFTKNQFRRAFRLSGQRTVELLDGFVAVGTLRVRVRDDRTFYVYRADTAAKAASTIHPELDESARATTSPKVVHFSSGCGLISEAAPRENIRDSSESVADSLNPPFSPSTVHFLEETSAEVDGGRELTPSPRARATADANREPEDDDAADLDNF
jgi:hypothetical protein